MLLFIDSETDGLPDWRAPSTSKQQPHIVQLAALLTDDDGHGKASMNSVVKPDGWEIPPEMTAIHGISQEHALQEGVGIKTVLQDFVDLLGQANLVVAHNVNFDARMIRIQMLRNRGRFGEWAKVWKTWPKFDTQARATQFCKLPPTEKMMAAGRKGFKTPKLEEALRILCGQEIGEDAHNASHDVKACRQVFFALHRLEPISIPTKTPEIPEKPPEDAVEGDDGPDDGIPTFDGAETNTQGAGEARTAKKGA